MAIRKVARMGHPVLKKVSTPVEDPSDPLIASLARDLVDTGEDLSANGIAAPQVYEPIRMFCFRVRTLVMPDGATMQPIPWTVCVNPAIEVLGDEQRLYHERCLSLPGLYGEVPRYTHIRFNWTDLDGKHHAMIARRYLARLLQHEFDHLDGVLYPMRMRDAGTLGYVSELDAPVYPTLPSDPADFIDPEPA